MSDTSTRSGMLWEVLRILTECKELGNLPSILVMENVPQIHSSDNIKDFHKLQVKLEELGYKNYWQDLIATDYGIPQTRNRTFMVSILGDYSYTFPKPIPLKLKLKDMLEDNVDEKYYLSDSMIKYISASNEKWTGNNGEALINKTYASTLNTNEGSRRCDASNYICKDLPSNFNLKNGCKQVYDLNYYNHEQSNRVYSPEYSSPTLRTKCDEAGTIKVAIGNKSLKETLEQSEIDDTCYIDTYNKRVDKEKSGTITTRVSASNNTFLAIKNTTKKENIIGTYQYSKSDNFMKGKDRLQLGKDTSDTLQTTPKEGLVNNDLRIRKLTPRECFRLMGVKDEDYEKCAKNQSDSSLYHLAGDSIVVDVLSFLFKQLI